VYVEGVQTEGRERERERGGKGGAENTLEGMLKKSQIYNYNNP
jgi:hypothetical protein